MAKTVYTKITQPTTPGSSGSENPTISIRAIKGITAKKSASGNFYTISGEGLLDRITALEGKTDNFVTGVTASREGNKVKLTYNFVTGQPKTVEFDDKDTIGIAYDDTALRNRIKALEDRPTSQGNDRQTLSLEGNKLKLTNGGEVNLDKYVTPTLRIAKGNIRESAITGTKSTIPLSSLANDDGVKPNDIVQDIISYPSGVVEFNYWKVTAVEGNNAKLLFMYQDLTHGYDDGELRGKIHALEKRPTPTKQKLSLSGNTLSLTDGGSVTLPSDKQTISKNGNKIVLSNGGGEVDIPTATPYNDADIKRRLGVLEAKPDNDKQTLSISGNTLSISNGNSVNIPQPNLSGYVPVAEYNKVKGALEKLLTDLKNSGAWRQTGSTVFEGELHSNRNIATGNINIFGGTVDGNSFIRTNNGRTENDLAGGI